MGYRKDSKKGEIYMRAWDLGLECKKKFMGK